MRATPGEDMEDTSVDEFLADDDQEEPDQEGGDQEEPDQEGGDQEKPGQEGIDQEEPGQEGGDREPDGTDDDRPQHEDGGDGEAERVESADPDATGDARDTDAVTPATTTHQWAPEGVCCDACGQTVERRWESEDGLVCADCKEW